MGLKRITDSIYALRFISLLTMKWEKTEAFKNGIIDKDGKLLKSPKTSIEKNSYTLFHRLAFNLKKLLLNSTIGKSSIVSYSASLLLLKENYGIDLGKDLMVDYNGKRLDEKKTTKLRILNENIYWDNEMIPKGTAVITDECQGDYYGNKVYECFVNGNEERSILLSEALIMEQTTTGSIAITESPLFDKKRINKKRETDYSEILKFTPGFYALADFRKLLLNESDTDKYIAEQLTAGDSVILESKTPVKATRLILFSNDI